MAKIKHNNIIDTASEIFTLARDRGVLHLYAQDEKMDGKYLTVKNKKTLNFGTCGYLRLEHHDKLKEASIDAIQRYGTQFPMSKSYISSPLYSELEDLIQQIYKAPAVISKNCTISHLATIPTLIRENDTVILDHLVHSSVQAAVQKLLPKGVNVEMIRHSNMEMLEETVNRLRTKYRRIWYMADGVYSMYGDFAPIKEMVALAEKYEQLYLYVDDAHGVSWTGENGAGYVMSQMGNNLHEKMILTATMGKAFGACGGVTLFPNKEWHHLVKIFGGPNTFSVQLEPAILGSAVASARLHMSDEIYEYQKELQERVSYCNELIAQTNLPLIEKNDSPIFFIGTGAMAMTNRLIERLREDGIYVNAAPFPAVPAKNTGIRITISLNNDPDEIKEMVGKVEYHFNEALLEVDQSHNKIRKAFKLPPIESTNDQNNAFPKKEKESLKIEQYSSIDRIDKSIWNLHLGQGGMFDWEGMKFLEDTYSGNKNPEDNWDFLYYIIKDENDKIVIITSCIVSLYKEDTFSQASISKQLEEIRQSDKYYLTSKAIVMGTMLTEGDHMYIDRSHPLWKKAAGELIEVLYHEQEKQEATNLVLRDFHSGDRELDDYMMNLGLVKVDMPESCVMEQMSWNNEEEFRSILSKKAWKNYKADIKKYCEFYDVEVKKTLNSQELDLAWKLFYNVRANNFALNTFAPPKKLIYNMNERPDWEFLILRLKPEVAEYTEPVVIIMCHKNEKNVYSAVLIGMNYDYIYQYRGYAQALFQIVKRAKQLNCPKVNFGVSATTEKKKIGATIYPKVAYVNARDNFNMELIGSTMVAEQD